MPWEAASRWASLSPGTLTSNRVHQRAPEWEGSGVSSPGVHRSKTLSPKTQFLHGQTEGAAAQPVKSPTTTLFQGEVNSHLPFIN